jgi:hypothetical protein
MLLPFVLARASVHVCVRAACKCARAKYLTRRVGGQLGAKGSGHIYGRCGQGSFGLGRPSPRPRVGSSLNCELLEGRQKPAFAFDSSLPLIPPCLCLAFALPLGRLSSHEEQGVQLWRRAPQA